jgi:hypothetical protein
MGFVRGFGRLWFDFVVGDDWRIALGVVLVRGVGALLGATDAIGANLLTPLLAAAIVAVVAASIVLGARR